MKKATLTPFLVLANAVNRTKQAIAGTVASLATAAVMAVSPVAEVGTAALAQNQIQEQVQQQTPALVRGLADIETERYRTVVAFTKQTTVVPVYNLEVASAHTFFVGEKGVLVHNQNCKCRISPEKILSPPIERGKAPIGMDNQPIELHHLDGDTVIEMTQEDHRGKGNYNKNHDRKKLIKPKRNPRKHWCDEWDSGRWSD